MIKLILYILMIITSYIPSTSWAEELLPRTIIGLYSKKDEMAPHYSNLHRMAEMPLNHLGLKLEIVDIDQGLPDIKNRKDIRGVLSWYVPGMAMEDSVAYIEWAISIVNSGKPFVIMGDPGFYEDNKGKATSIDLINKFWNKIGLKDNDVWIQHTYGIDFVYRNADITSFEREYIGYKPPFHSILPVDNTVTSHLITDSEQGHLITTGPNGSYIAEGYIFYFDEKSDQEVRQWYINPFEFFRRAFNTDNLPKPDTTTIAGRRIYYSHIDGDGWLSYTQLEQHRKKPIYTSEVILDQVIKPFPDLPVTVAPIGAEIDPKIIKDKKVIEITKELLALPQVELGSHSYSHPFAWSFFEHYSPDKERPFLHLFPRGGWKKGMSLSWYHRWLNEDISKTGYGSEGGKDLVKVELKHDYDIPRAYAYQQYTLEQEVNESIELIESLAPEGKKVKVMMWSGDTSPYEAAIAKTREAGIRNINGGDNRFDREYPSHAWVSPVGRAVGNQQQIYSSNSNENTYTDLWTGRFHGFKYLVQTIQQTETPVRLKPFNIYYHMYSGEKKASLNALLSNINFARQQEITPITASNYAAIADGFYSTNIVSNGTNSWRIKNRDGLQTIRFDSHLFKQVDLNKSIGVIGQRQFQGSLYVYLDEKVNEPIVTFKETNALFKAPYNEKAYLIESRWKIYNLKRSKHEIMFTAEGFGKGEMTWQMPKNGNYTIWVNGKQEKTIAVKNRVLETVIEANAIEPISIIVRPDV